jgi:hypothetical protein
MPTYYFNIVDRDGSVIKDIEGSRHSNDAEAHDQAKAAARELIAEALHHAQPLRCAAIEVCDADGNKLSSVDLDITSLLTLMQPTPTVARL